jgi:hypothetical protein
MKGNLPKYGGDDQDKKLNIYSVLQHFTAFYSYGWIKSFTGQFFLKIKTDWCHHYPDLPDIR